VWGVPRGKFEYTSLAASIFQPVAFNLFQNLSFLPIIDRRKEAFLAALEVVTLEFNQRGRFLLCRILRGGRFVSNLFEGDYTHFNYFSFGRKL
jgi:hypothetical protein